METLFVQCGECGIPIPRGEKCALAVETRKIGGKEYTFCCIRYAENFERRRFHQR
ncbi:MAG: hypothetical protein QME59_06715 [Candidatus Hydrothermarchaeota archaeon]|jgi:hypothetical protein|nr:hypothetical protein [Candidatus Hydrothermarchaeota archaeon]